MQGRPFQATGQHQNNQTNHKNHQTLSIRLRNELLAQRIPSSSPAKRDPNRIGFLTHSRLIELFRAAHESTRNDSVSGCPAKQLAADNIRIERNAMRCLVPLALLL